ncbi:MAG TPA: pseudouridine synthase [Actinomycetota bacterium]|nr:pseudouridine synthase [Actinomycetota bacterium]
MTTPRRSTRRARERTAPPSRRTGPAPDPAAPPAGGERLQKALARAGLGSRRSSEELIRSGRVTVNGRVASLGDRIDPARDRVAVDGDRVPLDPDLRYYVLHKPRGVVTTARDPQRRRDVTEFFPPGPRLFPVGRLDRDTEGVLLVTNDGELANRVMHPRYGVEKEYLAEVEGAPGRRHAARLVRGVELEDGPARASSASPVRGPAGRGAMRVVMAEGRKREVRRMLEAVGLPVRRLVRVRVGPVRLGRLRPGEVRELEPHEVRELWRER